MPSGGFVRTIQSGALRMRHGPEKGSSACTSKECAAPFHPIVNADVGVPEKAWKKNALQTAPVCVTTTFWPAVGVFQRTRINACRTVWFPTGTGMASTSYDRTVDPVPPELTGCSQVS